MPTEQQKDPQTGALNVGMRLTRQGRIDHRTMRGWIGEHRLWGRAVKAANREAGGDTFSFEDREQIAAEVVARTLAKIAGMDEAPPLLRAARKIRRPLTPTGPTAYLRAVDALRRADAPPPNRWRHGIAPADSPAVDYVTLCRLAHVQRVAMERERKHLAPAPEDKAGEVGGVVLGITGTGRREDAERTAAHFIAATGLDADSVRHRALAWHFARDLPEANEARRGTLSYADTARELDLTPAAYRQNIKRARADLRRLHPNPAELLAAIVGHRPVLRVDWPAVADRDAARAALAAGEPVPVVLDYSPAGQPWPTFPAYVVTARGELDRALHRWPMRPTREGTGPNGERIPPPTDLRSARYACRVRARTLAEGGTGKIDRRRRRTRSDADKLRARRALARAYRDESLERDGSRKLALSAIDPRTL